MCTHETISVVVWGVHHFLCTCKCQNNTSPWRSSLLLYPVNDTPFWLSASWKCDFISLSKSPTPFSPHPPFHCLQYHLLHWERGYNKCRTCALSSHMTIFTISNLLTVSKWWQYYRIFAESLHAALLKNVHRVWPSIWHGNQNLREATKTLE